MQETLHQLISVTGLDLTMLVVPLHESQLHDSLLHKLDCETKTLNALRNPR